MGDIADEHIDQMMERGYTWNYRAPPPPPRCDRCGAVCYWVMHKGRWTLNERGRQHVCPNQNSADGFEDEPV